MRWAAAMRKWPLPAAGSQTFKSRIACSGFGFLQASSSTGIKRRIEQAIDEARGRVVAAGGFALVASGGREG